MSLAESHGFIMWPRCVRTFFPFSKPPCSWLASGYAGIHILPTRAGSHSQATAHWNRQPVRENPTPGAIGPVVGGNLLSADAGRQGDKKRAGGEMKGGARMKEGHTLMRLITGASAAKAPNNGPCVCTCDVSCQIRRFWPPLPAHAPLLLPLLLLFLRFVFVFALGGLCPDEKQSR